MTTPEPHPPTRSLRRDLREIAETIAFLGACFIGFSALELDSEAWAGVAVAMALLFVGLRIGGKHHD